MAIPLTSRNLAPEPFSLGNEIAPSFRKLRELTLYGAIALRRTPQIAPQLHTLDYNERTASGDLRPNWYSHLTNIRIIFNWSHNAAEPMADVSASACRLRTIIPERSPEFFSTTTCLPDNAPTEEAQAHHGRMRAGEVTNYVLRALRALVGEFRAILEWAPERHVLLYRPPDVVIETDARVRSDWIDRLKDFGDQKAVRTHRSSGRHRVA